MKIKMMLAIILSLFALEVLVGCGQSGPLYLPPPPTHHNDETKAS